MHKVNDGVYVSLTGNMTLEIVRIAFILLICLMEIVHINGQEANFHQHLFR